MSYRLYASPGAGSAIIEAALCLCDIEHTIKDVDPFVDGASRKRLLAINPLGQVPVLTLPDTTVLTESAAMIWHLDDVAPSAGLVPPPGARSRTAFLRWQIYLVAAIYPTFTYGDEPDRYVSGKSAARELRASTDLQRERMWRQVEASAGAPWFLGDAFSAIDLYLWVMVRWRPRRPWFEEHCPKIAAIADRLDGDGRLAKVRLRNFG